MSVSLSLDQQFFAQKHYYSFHIQYIMNTRILRSSNTNKKPLQIVRSHKAKHSTVNLPRTDCIKQPNFHAFDSSKEVLHGALSPQQQNRSFLQEKKTSFSVSRTTCIYQPESGGVLGKRGVLKKRSFSSGLPNAPSLREKTLEEVMGGYVEMLRGRNLIHTHFNTYIVEVNKFSKILTFIISAYNASDSLAHFQQKLLREEEAFGQFMRRAERGRCPPAGSLKFRQLLSLVPAVYECTVQNERQGELVGEVRTLQERSLELKRELVELRGRREELQGEVARKHSEFTIVSYQIGKLQYDFDQYIKREEYIRSVINAKESVLAELEQRHHTIGKIYEEQQMAATRQCFQDYRRLEESLFLFCDFLKCNPLGQRPYRPSKKTVLNQRLLQKEVRQIKRALSSASFVEQGLLDSFLGRYHQMGELERVVGEKTELIGRFTRLMEEWRGQHIRKQQILANMKDNLLLGEIQCKRIKEREGGSQEGSSQESILKVTHNIIRLFKVCQPLL